MKYHLFPTKSAIAKTISVTMTAILVASSASVSIYAQEYSDKEQILDAGFSLDTEHDLKIANPSKDISTVYETYYITGSSDPDYPLLCNGEEVNDRGRYGSFGVFAELKEGENEFVFQNGEQTASVIITKTVKTSSGEITTISNLKQINPSSDDIVQSGEIYKIRCTAPANGEVSATLNGKTYSLKQEAIATTGVEAYYSAEITLPEAENGEVKNIGPIRYDLMFEQKASFAVSEGNLYLLGKDAHLLGRVNQNAAVLYEKGDSGSNHVSLTSRGAIDQITAAEGSYFQLGMGSWINKSYIDLLPEETQWKNKVTKTSYQSNEKGDTLTLDGTNSPIYKAYQTDEKVVIKLYYTTGVKAKKWDSDLFSSVNVSVKDGDTVLELMKKDGAETVGYDISYDGAGKTEIFFLSKAQKGTEEQPLSNMTVVVDPGHGGLDSGALGVLNGNGPTEKDITMAHSLVLKNRLESLGATVILAVSPQQDTQSKAEMTDRVEMARENHADFYVSLHCNSVAETTNGLKPAGTEVYYYENNSKLLADSVLKNITDYNQRKSRSVIYGNFYVTRNSLCPSMLVEMGFISNPIEYDELCSPDSMYQTANAIADSLIEYLG